MRSVGLIWSAFRLAIAAMAPTKEHAARAIPKAAGVIHAERAVELSAAVAVTAEAAAADIADGVFTRSAWDCALGNALRIAGPLLGVFRRRNEAATAWPKGIGLGRKYDH